MPIRGTVPEDPFRRPLGEPHHYAYVVEANGGDRESPGRPVRRGLFVLVEKVPLQIRAYLARGDAFQASRSLSGLPIRSTAFS
jgi:hypothetical protein